jgi:hypothetical protein
MSFFSTESAPVSKHAALTKQLMNELLENRVEGKLMPKRKTKQLKLKQALEKRNFQKYHVDKCVYDPRLKRYVYEPPKYKKEFDPLELLYAHCCEHCYLRPCLMVGKKIAFIQSLKADHGEEDPDFSINNAKTLAVNCFRKYCGKLWTNRMKIFSESMSLSAGPPLASVPACVNNALPRLLKQAMAELDDKLKADHEEVSSCDEFEMEN